MKNIIILFQLLSAFFFFKLINTKICSSNNEEEKINLILSKTLKICPDFKDEPEQIACCPSQITSGSFFCCTEQHKNDLESELAAEARKKFISKHIPQLILLILAFLILLFFFCSYLCRRTRFCPLLHRRKASSNNSIIGGSGRCLGSSLNDNSTTEFSCRPFNTQQQQRRSFSRSYHNYQNISQNQQINNNRPLNKECEIIPPPPPYSLAISSSSSLNNTALNCNLESRQNKINIQREQQNQRESLIKEEDEEENNEK